MHGTRTSSARCGTSGCTVGYCFDFNVESVFLRVNVVPSLVFTLIAAND